jgi:Ser/Thr protein kinase RdoA (MazF antagonist)
MGLAERRLDEHARAPGHPPQEGDPRTADRGLPRRWGAAMGRMHAWTQGHAGEVAALPTWDEEHAGFTQWSADDPPAQVAWMALRPALEALPRSDDRYGVVHNDLHAHNLLVEGDRLTVIDFDVCARHWFTAEIATALFSVLWAAPAESQTALAEASRAFLGPFLEGYACEAPLPPDWELDLPLFLRYRERLLYVVFAHAWAGATGAWQRDWLERTRRRGLDDGPALYDLCVGRDNATGSYGGS